MSLGIVRASIEAEDSNQLHESRLLLLLKSASSHGDGQIDGITKLAKLDFFVRYPLFAQKLFDDEYKRPPRVPRQEFEEKTVESKMIRYRYGPWDHRYRRWIALLVSKGLVYTFLKGRTVHVGITPKGTEIAKILSETESFSDQSGRIDLILSKLWSRSGNWLKNRTYELIPELADMQYGEVINYAD